MRVDKALLREILNRVYLGQGEEKKAKYREIKVHYVCLTELEPRIYSYTFLAKGQAQVSLAETGRYLKLTPRGKILK